MAPRATPKAAPTGTTRRTSAGSAPPPPARPGNDTGQTAAIAALVAELRTIRRRVATGTGLSIADDDRIRAINVEIDRLWAELRRQRLPLPRLPDHPTVSPPARSAARR